MLRVGTKTGKDLTRICTGNSQELFGRGDASIGHFSTEGFGFEGLSDVVEEFTRLGDDDGRLSVDDISGS